MIAIASCLLLFSFVAAGIPVGPPSATTYRKPPSLVAVSLADGNRVAGQLVWREGDRRPWLRVTGISTVLMRPLSADQVATIEPLVPKPASSRSRDDSETPRSNRRTDAEMAHRLLFGEP